MKLKYLYLGLIAAIPLLHCFYNEEKGCNEAPIWCNESEPASGRVKIRISPQYLTDSSRVLIYRGKIEEGYLLESHRQTADTVTYHLSYGYISAKIEYSAIIKGKPAVVTAIDGAELKAKSDEYCDEVVCYAEGKMELDLRIDVGVER